MAGRTDEQWMQLALDMAAEALRLDESPIGCVIINPKTQEVIAKACNRREVDNDPTAHAELLAIRAAGAAIGDWRLNDLTLYVTLEPCPMCAGAIVNARIERVVWGCDDPKAGATKTLYQLASDPRLNHRAQLTSGVLAEECAKLLKDFFLEKRQKGKKKPEQA